jgi:hypothetical protein
MSRTSTSSAPGDPFRIIDRAHGKRCHEIERRHFGRGQPFSEPEAGDCGEIEKHSPSPQPNRADRTCPSLTRSAGPSWMKKFFILLIVTPGLRRSEVALPGRVRIPIRKRPDPGRIKSQSSESPVPQSLC